MAFGERTQVTEPASVFLWQKSLWGVKHLACLSVVATSKTGLGVHCPEAQLEGEIEISAPYCLVFPKVVVFRPVMQTLTWSFKLEKLYFSHLSPVLYLEVPSPPCLTSFYWNVLEKQILYHSETSLPQVQKGGNFYNVLPHSSIWPCYHWAWVCSGFKFSKIGTPTPYNLKPIHWHIFKMLSLWNYPWCHILNQPKLSQRCRVTRNKHVYNVLESCPKGPWPCIVRCWPNNLS